MSSPAPFRSAPERVELSGAGHAVAGPGALKLQEEIYGKPNAPKTRNEIPVSVTETPVLDHVPSAHHRWNDSQ